MFFSIPPTIAVGWYSFHQVLGMARRTRRELLASNMDEIL